MMRGYGRRGNWGRGRGGGWPGNGPFRNLPPWERPGWLYGPGSCWTLGYWRSVEGASPFRAPISAIESQEVLQQQRTALESQMQSLQEMIEAIERRMNELEKEE